MKTFYSMIWVALLFFSLSLFGQPCNDTLIVLQTQAEIDSFAYNYPGYIEISGDLSISGDSITNLNGLIQIERIEGSLMIENTPVLSSLNGFENLNYIGKDLVISKCPEIENLDGIVNLDTIIGTLRIEKCNSLVRLTHFINLTKLGAIYFFKNNNLEDITGLENIEHTTGSLYFNEHHSLYTLSGLDNLKTIGGGLSLKNMKITNLQPFTKLERIEKSLVLYNNYALTSLTALNNLKYIGGSFYFDSNDNIENFSGLENVDTIMGGFTVIHSYLTGVNGFSSLSYIGGKFYVSQNYYLTEISGFDNLSIINGDFIVEKNDVLTDIKSLDNVLPDSIKNLTIQFNPVLEVCNTQSICDYLSNPNGTVIIRNNAQGCNSPPKVAQDCWISLSCLPYGNYYFSDQHRLNRFRNDYNDCTELNGEVIIQGADISNLYGLNRVTTVHGDLSIIGENDCNTNLHTLEGLHNITQIDGDFIIKGNKSLESIEGLDSLRTIAGSFVIESNKKLDNITGVSNLQLIGSDLRINANPNLQTLKGLENLTSVSGYFELISNYGLKNLSGLNNIEALNTFTVDYNGFKNFEGLNRLKVVEGDFNIGDDFWGGENAITSLSGLDSLQRVIGLLYIYGNPSLQTVNGLKSLKSVGDLWIYDNDLLLNLNGLETLDTVFNNLILSGLTLTEGVLGLQNLKYVGGLNLIDLQLNELTGFNSLNQIDGGFYVSKCNRLKNFGGLENMEHIKENMLIFNNDSLAQIESLKNLHHLDGDIWIMGNPLLASLNGLENIKPQSVINLKIYNNPSLSACAVKSICLYLAAPNGEVDIYNNASGCHSVQEVENKCSIVNVPETEEYENSTDIAVYPNPTTGLLYIENKIAPRLIEVRLYNSLGQCLLYVADANQLNLSSLKTGIYFLKIKTKTQVFFKKVLVSK